MEVKMLVKSEVGQELTFSNSEFQHLCGVEAKFYNGYFQKFGWQYKSSSTGTVVEFRGNMDALKELQKIVNTIIDFGENKGKQVTEKLATSKGRLLRVSDISDEE